MIFSSTGRAGTSFSASRAKKFVKPMNSRVLATLNTVWALAIWRGTSAAIRALPLSSGELGEIAATKSANCGINNTQSSTPAILNVMCTTAARTASTGLPREARMAVTQVPMLEPKASAIPAGRVIRPADAITIAMPVVAADDWTRPVNTAPTRIPSSGFSILTMRSRNGW